MTLGTGSLLGRRVLWLWAALLIGVTLAAAPAQAAGSSAIGRSWVARYNGPDNLGDDATAIAVSPDATAVYVTGRSYDTSSSMDYATIAYDAATGQHLWVSRYNGSGNGYDSPAGLVVSPDGATVFVTGSVHGPDGENNYGTVAYVAATGAKLWASEYDGPLAGNDDAAAIATSPDGATVYVTGESVGTGAFNYGTVAYDASNGSQVWASQYNGPVGGDDSATALALSPDGSTLYVTGDSVGSGTQEDYATVAYAASTGTQQWVARYDGAAGSDYAYGIASAPDGSAVYVTGYITQAATGSDYGTIAYSSSGALLWTAQYNGPANGGDVPVAIRVSPDGTRLFTTGYSVGLTSADYATVAYGTQDGTQLWASTYDGPGGSSDTPWGMTISPDGRRVYVTGYSEDPSGKDRYTTVAYRATSGSSYGVFPFGNKAPGTAKALAISPDGSELFVTGQIQHTDYGTIAYSIGG